MIFFIARAIGACLLSVGAFAPMVSVNAAQQPGAPTAMGAVAPGSMPWTLASAIQRAVEVAPERRAQGAALDARSAELGRDSAFPNPTIEARLDQRLGIEQGNGGTDVTQLAISQPLPLWRRAPQRAQAQGRVDAARADLHYRQLLIENAAAQAFYRLQHAQARLRLAEARAAATLRYDRPERAGGKLVRYLSALDRTRLSILGQSARLEQATADGEWRESLARFGRMLGLRPDDTLTTIAPVVPERPAPLADLAARLEGHPALRASRSELDAARAGIAAARATRFADPVLTLFRERDVFGAGRQDYWGAAIGIEVPLWNSGRSSIDVAVAEADRSAAEGETRRRDLETALRSSHLRLSRLVEQVRQYTVQVVEPSRRFLELTDRSFAAGELGVLALLDASSTYYDSEQQYLGLVLEAAMAASDLRLAAGDSVLKEVQP